MKRRVMACLAACVLLSPVLHPAAALAGEDDRIIWSPSKTGDNAYTLRMGAKLPGRWDASGGAEVSVSATKAGKVEQALPVGFWGLFSRNRGTGTARITSQDVNVRFDAVNGSGNIAISCTRRWIVTPRLDVETRRSLALQCNAYENHCHSTSLSQSARITAAGKGSALVASGALANDGLHALQRLGIEQQLGKLSLGAAVADPTSSPHAVFSARYVLSW